MRVNKQIKTHLEYLGYAMVPDDDALFMKPGIPNTYLVDLGPESIGIRGLYRYNDIATNNEYCVLQYVNSLNLKTNVVTFIKGDGYLGFHATYNGKYDRIGFGRFIQAWEDDLTNVLESFWETRCYLSKELIDTVPDYRGMIPHEKYLA